MSTGNLLLPVTCPRCDGSKFIAAFGHVAQGRCFLCLGAGVVSRPVFNKFMGVCETPKGSKRVELPGFGSVLICKDNVGLTAQLACGQVWFSVENNQVTGVIVSDGIVKIEAEVTAALQSALKKV